MALANLESKSGAKKRQDSAWREKKALAAPKFVPTNVFPALQAEEKRAKCHSLKYEIEMLGTIRELLF